MSLVFSMKAEVGVILLLEFYDPNWVNFDILSVKIDPYSGLKIDPELLLYHYAVNLSGCQPRLY